MTDASEHRDQLRHLNDSLVSGSLSRQEYDELLPFVASPTAAVNTQQDPTTATTTDYTSNLAGNQSDAAAFTAALAQARDPEASVTPPVPNSQRNVRFTDGGEPADPVPEPILAPISSPRAAPMSTQRAGLQLRCPACGTCNDTLYGPRCDVCNSRLTIGDEFSASGGRSSSRAPIVTATAPHPRPNGAFTTSEDGRVIVHNGFFACNVQDTQTLATSEGNTCEVYVMCCHWQPRASENLLLQQGQQSEAIWYVSQRFSQFEKLHKMLKKRLSRSSLATMPPFPAKYHFTDRLEKRKQGLSAYVPRLLEMCANLPHAQPAPELDEFLDLSQQIQLFCSRNSSTAAAPAIVGSDLRRQSDASIFTATTLESSHFPAFSGPAMLPVTRPQASPMDEMELAQAEGAVRLLTEAVRRARGDVRGDGTVQHHLDVCVQLAPALLTSADVGNPFANTELIPRAMQCQEDLQRVVALYNDALLAASELNPAGQVQAQAQAQHVQQPEQEPLPHVQAMPMRNIVPASAA